MGETFITVKEFEAPLPGRGDEGRQPPPGAVERCCCLAYLPLRPTDKVAATPSSPRRPLFSWKVEDGSFTTMFTHSQNCRRELSTQQGSDVALDGLEAVSISPPACKRSGGESQAPARVHGGVGLYEVYTEGDRQACASRTPSPFSSRSTNNAPACRQFLQPPHVAAGCPHAPRGSNSSQRTSSARSRPARHTRPHTRTTCMPITPSTTALRQSTQRLASTYAPSRAIALHHKRSVLMRWIRDESTTAALRFRARMNAII